jgi:hypothetical protein
VHFILFCPLFCCAVLRISALLLRNVLILVAFSVLLLVLARDVWENLGKWNKMGGAVFGSLALLCGAAAGCSLRSALVHFGALVYSPPLFLHFQKKFLNS